MYYNAFFPHKSSVGGGNWLVAFAPGARAKAYALEELAFAAETFLPRESELMMLIHGDELVVGLKVDAHEGELTQYTQMLTRAAVLNSIFLTPSGQAVSRRDLSTLSL